MEEWLVSEAGIALDVAPGVAGVLAAEDITTVPMLWASGLSDGDLASLGIRLGPRRCILAALRGEKTTPRESSGEKETGGGVSGKESGSGSGSGSGPTESSQGLTFAVHEPEETTAQSDTDDSNAPEETSDIAAGGDDIVAPGEVLEEKIRASFGAQSGIFLAHNERWAIVAANARELHCFDDSREPPEAGGGRREPSLRVQLPSDGGSTICVTVGREVHGSPLVVSLSKGVFMWRSLSELAERQGSLVASAAAETLDGVPVGSHDLVFDESGSAVVACCHKNSVVLVELEGGTAVATLTSGSSVTQCAFLRAEGACHLIVTISYDRTFTVWDLDKGTAALRSSVIGSAPLLSVGADSSFLRFAIGSDDGILRFFEVFEGPSPSSSSELVQRYREVRSLKLGSLLVKKERAAATTATADERSGGKASGSRNGTVVMHGASEGGASGPAVGNVKRTKLAPTVADAADAAFRFPLHFIRYVSAASGRNTTGAEPPRQWALVGTLSYLVGVDIGSLETEVVFSSSSPESGSAATAAIAAVACDYVDTFEAVSALVWIHGEKYVRLLTWREPAPLSIEGKSALVETGVPEDSILADWDYAPKKLDSPRGARGRGRGARRGKRPSTDSPLTFHRTVKSSGYGTPPTHTKLHSPASGTGTRGGGRPRGAGARVKSAGRIQKAASAVPPPRRSYDGSRGLPMVFQEKHDVLPDAQRHPIRKLMYARDGTRLCVVWGAHSPAAATAESLKLPVSKWTGSGTSYQGHTAAVTDISEARNNQLLLTASSDQTVGLWGPGGERVMSIDSTMSALPKRNGAAAAGAPVPVRPALGEIVGARFFLNDKFILVASGGTVRLVKYHVDATPRDDIQHYKTTTRYKSVARLDVRGVAVTALDCLNDERGHLALSASSEKCVEVFDLSVLKRVRSFSDAHAGAVHTIRCHHPSPFSSHAAASYDLFLSSGLDGDVKLWDLRAPKSVNTFSGHANRVMSVGCDFSPDLRYIATGSEDNKAYVYDIRTAGFAATLRGHRDTVVDVKWHPLHPQLVSGSLDGRIRFFSDR
jgi:WD40 repeat protein